MSSTPRAHPKGHAVLHDFCVVFPASAFFLGIGSLGLLLGGARTAAATAAVGAVQFILSRQSLQCWRAGTGSQVYTLAEAGEWERGAALCQTISESFRLLLHKSGACVSLVAWLGSVHDPSALTCLAFCLFAAFSILVAYLTYQGWQQGMSKVFVAPTFMVSSLVALFLLYNVLAGGNPPPKKGV